MSESTDPTRGYQQQPQSYPQYAAAPPVQSGYYPTQATMGAAPAAGPPPSNAGWAVASVLFFWPLAFTTFNHLHDIYPKWAMGDYQGAQEASDRVKRLGKTALWIAVGFFLLFVVLYAVIIAAAISSYGTYG